MTQFNTLAENSLEAALDSGEINQLRELKDNGMDINILLDDGRMLLMEAVRAGDINIVQQLLDIGADVNIQQPGGYTALWIAAYWGLEDIFNLLAPLTDSHLYEEAKAELLQGIIRRRRRENVWLDFLTTAVISCNRESILEAIRDGCDINTINEDGKTVLFIASLWGYYDIVKLLVNNGADINFQSEDGNDTPLIAALSGMGMVKYHTFLSDKTKYQHTLVLQLLLSSGASANAKTTEGWSALLAAINIQSVEAVKILLDYEADVNTRNNQGKTALNLAKERGDNQIIQLLLDAGALE